MRLYEVNEKEKGFAGRNYPRCGIPKTYPWALIREKPTLTKASDSH